VLRSVVVPSVVLDAEHEPPRQRSDATAHLVAEPERPVASTIVSDGQSMGYNGRFDESRVLRVFL
jgi:hypothetical protein